jgi:hypothetical protein
MKISSRISISTVSLLVLIAGVIGKAPRADAQTGTVQFVARVTPSGGLRGGSLRGGGMSLEYRSDQDENRQGERLFL